MNYWWLEIQCGAGSSMTLVLWCWMMRRLWLLVFLLASTSLTVTWSSKTTLIWTSRYILAYIHYIHTYIQDGPETVSFVIIAKTLSTAINFHNFWHIYTVGNWQLEVSPSNMVCVTTLPCKILIVTLHICVHVYHR